LGRLLLCSTPNVSFVSFWRNWRNCPKHGHLATHQALLSVHCGTVAELLADAAAAGASSSVGSCSLCAASFEAKAPKTDRQRLMRYVWLGVYGATGVEALPAGMQFAGRTVHTAATFGSDPQGCPCNAGCFLTPLLQPEQGPAQPAAHVSSAAWTQYSTHAPGTVRKLGCRAALASL
jgi:hypothetical protein